MDLVKLSRAVSHALRHEPWVYELELDINGWVPTNALIQSLRREYATWSQLNEADLERMVAASEKKRHEILDGKIRAYYGHSTPQKLARNCSDPPAILYHGTSPETFGVIRKEGLKPMGRQYVHLSVDSDTATKVGERKASTPIILRIDAKAAAASGIPFYHGNEMVWLADAIPPAFIT